MPKVFRTFAIDADDQIVTELWGKREPTDGELRALITSADRFDDLRQVVDFQTRAGMACRRCGCTSDRACPGGCSWVEPDLCSGCPR